LTLPQSFVKLRSGMGTIVLLVIVVIGLLLLVGWHARTFAYRCRNCGSEFAIPILMDLVSPHGPGRGGGWKFLRCPRCNRWTRAFVIRKSERRRD
jgi:hypothetical protein